MANNLRRKLRVMALVSIATVFVAGLPISMLHEAGHGLICNAEEHKFEFELTLTGAVGHCFGDVQNVTAFLALGGSIAGATAGMLAVFTRNVNKGLYVGFLTLAIGQGFNAIMETAFYDLYMGTFGIVSVQMVVLGTWMALITLVIRKEAQRVRLTA